MTTQNSQREAVPNNTAPTSSEMAQAAPVALTDGESLSVERQINAWIDGERKALSGDDPSSTCAAYHRGAINAYSNVLEKLEDQS